MFSRTNEKDQPRPPEPATAFGNTKPPTAQPRPTPTQSGNYNDISVIGTDLAIIGSGLKIVTQGTLQIDGEVQGDVLGSKIIISQNGRVTGLVNAEAVLVEGKVFGTIKAVDVTLKSTAMVEGDIFHRLFTLEQGASFEGRSRRPDNQEELIPNLNTADHAQQPHQPAAVAAG
jgi:cytoskeletal protein CcmA (bactofilin family)